MERTGLVEWRGGAWVGMVSRVRMGTGTVLARGTKLRRSSLQRTLKWYSLISDRMAIALFRAVDAGRTIEGDSEIVSPPPVVGFDWPQKGIEVPTWNVRAPSNSWQPLELAGPVEVP